MLRFEKIVKRFGDRTALDGVSFVANSHQTTVLLGPSGCGKSTLLRIAMGLVPPDSGSLLIDGMELSRHELYSLRHRMGYVIQDGGLFPHLTGEQNLTLLPRLLKKPKSGIRKRVEELCHLTSLSPETLRQYPHQLSGGQKQRVALMRALMLNPEALLMDEPLGALDPLIRQELQSDLKNIFSNLKKTVILVTHDLNEAGFFGDHIVLLRKGSIVQQGPLQQLLENPADPFVTRFINAQLPSWRSL